MIRKTLGIVVAFAIAFTPASGFGRDADIEIWCPDLNADGQVDVSDIEILMESWGECLENPHCPGEPCPADINLNGFVGRLDLAMILGNWGPCRCKGDINRDGLRDQVDVDLIDAAIAAELDCRPDLDDSGTVDEMDFHIELASWTSEPDSDLDADVNDTVGLDPGDVLSVFDAMVDARDCHADLTGEGRIDAIDRLLVAHMANLEPECP